MSGDRKQTGSADSKKDPLVYKICVGICRWFLVGLLTWFCSLPVFTIGAASCAALAVSREDDTDIRDIFGSYFSFFRVYFSKATPVFLLFLLFLLLQILNLSFYHQFSAPGTLLRYLLTGIILLLILTAVSLLRFYNYEITSGENLTFKQRFSKAFTGMMRCLPAAGLLALADIVILATIAAAPVAIPVLMIYPGFHAFLTCLLISLFSPK